MQMHEPDCKAVSNVRLAGPNFSLPKRASAMNWDHQQCLNNFARSCAWTSEAATHFWERPLFGSMAPILPIAVTPPGCGLPKGAARVPGHIAGTPAPAPVGDNFVRITDAALGQSRRGKAFRRKIPKVRVDAEDADKAALIEKWTEIMCAIGSEHSEAFRRWEATSPSDRQLHLEALFSGAPDTLRRHLGAINLYRAWAVSEGRAPFPLVQRNVLDYATFLYRSGAPPSRACSFQKAGKYIIAKLGLSSPNSIFADQLFNGLVDMCLSRKPLVKEAVAYSVMAMAALERAVYDPSLLRPLRIIAGFARFCIGARLRHGDATRIHIEPVVLPHVAFVQEKGHAFIETTATINKTSQTRQRMKRAIPVAAHAWGIATEGWAAVWLKLRDKAGLEAGEDKTLMPACGPDLRFVSGV